MKGPSPDGSDPRPKAELAKHILFLQKKDRVDSRKMLQIKKTTFAKYLKNHYEQYCCDSRKAKRREIDLI